MSEREYHQLGATAETVEPGDTLHLEDGDVLACRSKGSNDMGWWQVGTCRGCGVRTIAQSKWAICYNCGAEVYGT